MHEVIHDKMFRGKAPPDAKWMVFGCAVIEWPLANKTKQGEIIHFGGNML